MQFWFGIVISNALQFWQHLLGLYQQPYWYIVILFFVLWRGMKFYYIALKLDVGEIEGVIKSGDTRIWSFWIIKSNIPKLYYWMSVRFSFYISFATSNVQDINKYQRAFEILIFLGFRASENVPLDTSEFLLLHHSVRT